MMTTHTTKSPRLSTSEVEQFQRDGYYLPQDPVFPQEKFDGLKEHFETKLAAWPKDQRPEGMDVPHFTDPKLFEWVLSDEVLDLVEPILGPDLALFSTHFICKPKGDGRRVPWHEDSAYWKTMLDPMEVVTVWLAIDPSRLENGCMNVIPHTHRTGKMGYSDYDDVDIAKNVFPNEIKASQRNDAQKVPCILEANHCSLHDGRLMHGSEPNTSNIRRCGYTMRFIRSSTRLSEQAREWHQIYLARGRDLAGQPYADPTQSYATFAQVRTARGKNGH